MASIEHIATLQQRYPAVDLSLYRARVRVAKGDHDGTHYPRAYEGVVVNISPSDTKPYCVRLDGWNAWDVTWYTRDELEVVA